MYTILVATASDAADIWLVGLRYLVYRATSHEHTVRGMWLSEEFHRLLEATSVERINNTTPTDSTSERNGLSVHDGTLDGVNDALVASNDYSSVPRFVSVVIIVFCWVFVMDAVL